jgi:hypothetical protein
MIGCNRNITIVFFDKNNDHLLNGIKTLPNSKTTIPKKAFAMNSNGFLKIKKAMSTLPFMTEKYDRTDISAISIANSKYLLFLAIRSSEISRTYFPDA